MAPFQTLLQPKVLAITVLGFFEPVTTLLLATFCLVMLDAALGLIVAVKKRRKITSHKFARSFGKLAVYLVLICLSYVLQTIFLPDTKLTPLITTWIGVGEGMSILEKVNVFHRISLIDRLIDALKAKK